MVDSFKDLARLGIHSITTRPWGLEEALTHYCENGIRGISVWQNAIEDLGAKRAGELLKSYPIDVISYVRGGFFPSATRTGRQKAIELNKKMLEEAAAIDAPLLVLVCGSDPGQSLETSRGQIKDGIESILPLAAELNVRLGIEPLHPMYADTRSAINTLGQANAMAEAIHDDMVGIVIDVYHLWWDERLKQEIMRCGANGNIFAFHICDWKINPGDLLNDRGLMGEGCIPVREIRSWVEEAGFLGFCEVEIFSNRYWKMDQSEFLELIIFLAIYDMRKVII